MSRPADPSAPALAGFTLVEALAALTIVAISMATIGALANSSMRSSLYVGRHLAEIETTRKILAGIPSRRDLAEGLLKGNLDNHRWVLDSEPYPNPLSSPNAAILWEPESLALRVLSPDGAVVEIETIRLKKRGPT